MKMIISLMHLKELIQKIDSVLEIKRVTAFFNIEIQIARIVSSFIFETQQLKLWSNLSSGRTGLIPIRRASSGNSGRSNCISSSSHSDMGFYKI